MVYFTCVVKYRLPMCSMRFFFASAGPRIGLLILFVALSSSVYAQAILNDDCLGAIPLQCGETVSENTTPLLEPSFTDLECDVIAPVSTGQWFAFEGTGESLTVSSCGALFNSSIAVFSGSCINLLCVAHETAASGECPDQSFDNASVSFQTSLGVPYYIYLFGSGSDASISYTLAAACTEPSPVPINNECETALLLEVGGPSFSTTNSGATASSQTFTDCPSNGSDAAQNDVWFSFQGPESGRIVVETLAGELQNTRMQILDGCSESSIACDDDSGNGLMSRIEIPCDSYIPGQEFLIQVDGLGETGTFSISVATISCTQITGCTNPIACNYNPEASIDDESCLIPEPGCTACEGDELTPIDADEDGVCNAEDGCPNDPNKTEPGLCGCGEIDVDENANGICDSEESPGNDLPCDAIAIECGDMVVAGTFGASQQETCASEENRVGVWYEIEITELSVVSLQTCFKETNFEAEISVFSGPCDNLSCLTEVDGTGFISAGTGCENSSGSNGVLGEFVAIPGVYHIMVHGSSEDESGNFALSLSCEPVLETHLNGTVAWNSDCGQRDCVVDFYDSVTSILAASQDIVISENGSFSIELDITGSYDIYLKIDGYLAVSELNVDFDGDPINLFFDTPSPGDITGSNAIGLPDFSAFSTAYGSEIGASGYNPLADFNCDGTISLQDFSVFSSNYGLTGLGPE